MARKERKYHYIYKITCLKNNRYYIGMHSTDNLDDGYFGGGKRIKNSVKKHGKDAHRKKILEFFESRDLLRQREIELVNEELVNDPMCMNLALGGGGGNGWSKECQSKGAIKANIKNWNNEEYVEKIKRSSSLTMNKLWADPEKSKRLLFGLENSFKGKKHKQSSKEKMSLAASERIGNKNNQYGKIWIHSTIEKKSIIISKEKLPYYLEIDWKIGRKMKF